MIGVIHVEEDLVGPVLVLLGCLTVALVVAAFMRRDYVTQDPNRTLLGLAVATGVGFLTLALSA